MRAIADSVSCNLRAAAVLYPLRRIAGAFRNLADAPCGGLALPASEQISVLSSARRRADNVTALVNVRWTRFRVQRTTMSENLASTDCGEKTYNYICNFLRNRTATIGIDSIRTDPLPVPNKGTPQGSVLSPTLFNLARRKLPEQLEEIPHIRRTLYADDLTIWTTSGSEGSKQDALQTAVDTVQRYLTSGNLQCSAEKSELLLLHRRNKRHPDQNSNIELYLDGSIPIPTVPRLRVLGLHLQADGRANYTIQTLQKTVTQIMRMVGRITNRKHGLKETDVIQLTQALITSHITYSIPYLNLNQDKLLAMGVHNTLQELIQAHLASQQERLALNPTGRTVLHNLHFPIPSSVRNTVRLPTAIQDHIQVAPIPKNMHPILHSGRRIARARALQHKYSSKADTCFTDAAMYSDQPAAAVSVIDHDLKTVVTASIRTINPVEAEETAIALAIASGKEYLNILSDSQTALRRFRAGRISPCALRILTDLKTPLPETTLIWTPGHESVDGNRQAHAVARACTHRVPQTEDHNTILKFIPVPNQYSEILIHQRGERFRHPPPHRSLTREEAVIWR
ncbi:uncharacterized protein ISCGN_009438 [Ixodes scapularis]